MGNTQFISPKLLSEQPVGGMDDDWAVCPTCRAEYCNMDFEGGDLEGDSPLEFCVIQTD